MGQRVKSAVSRRWGQGGGACFNTAKLCGCFETGGLRESLFGRRVEGRRLVAACEALGLVAGDRAQVEGVCV